MMKFFLGEDTFREGLTVSISISNKISLCSLATDKRHTICKIITLHIYPTSDKHSIRWKINSLTRVTISMCESLILFMTLFNEEQHHLYNK